jgi:hypothetical protein
VIGRSLPAKHQHNLGKEEEIKTRGKSCQEKKEVLQSVTPPAAGQTALTRPFGAGNNNFYFLLGISDIPRD